MVAEKYTETPLNMEEIISFVVTDPNDIVRKILTQKACFFYDTCSFRRHANLRHDEALCIMNYIKAKNGIIVITRCILLELASHSGILNKEYIAYMRELKEAGIDVLIMYEEDLFTVLGMCFSTNEIINKHLCWAVRNIISPAGTITETIEENPQIKEEVVKGKNLTNSKVYKKFFAAVRSNKRSDDDLGEETLAICLYLLASLPGEDDGKFCVITDDKEAASKLSLMNQKAEKHAGGKKIMILSTPKLTQIMYREHFLMNQEQAEKILSAGIDGNIVILGARIFDIRAKDISISCRDLAELIATPNGIHVIF